MSTEIIGRSCRIAGANSPEELFRLLRDGTCTVTEIPHDRWDKARYWHPDIGVPGKTYTFAAGVLNDYLDIDPAVFGISPREAESLDPQQRVILHLAWRAMEDANLDPETLKRERVGVYIGASSLEYSNLIVGDPAAATPYQMTGSTLSIVSNRISHVFGLSGPSMTVDTACSSGLVALNQAIDALEAGKIDTAIVGGVNILAHPLSFVGFAQARMLSPEGLCRAYGANGQGYVRAEGGALFILRRTDHARACGDRSHARILGSGVNSARRTTGISLPSPEAQADLLATIYRAADIHPGQLAFIEGHGTGTKVGDPAEVWAIGNAIGQRRPAPIPIGSIKSNIGHTEPASGLFGLMKAVLALENNYLPATLHAETLNEDIDFSGLNVSVATQGLDLLASKNRRYAGVNSFGFGGSNAHVIVGDPDPAEAPAADGEGSGVLLLSAHTADALSGLMGAWRDTLADAEPATFSRMVSAAGANRPHLRHRFVARADTPAEIASALDAGLAAGPAAEIGQALRDQAKTAFVFSGNGSQWVGMGLDAYANSPSFRSHFNVADALYANLSGMSLRALLEDEQLADKLADTRIAQPLLFATQYGLAMSLIDAGLRPTVTFGHSIGEVAAALVAGAISLSDAVNIVFLRSRHQHKVAGMGKMAAVALSGADAIDFARSAGIDDVVCAAQNSARSSTVSGPSESIVRFCEVARSRDIAARMLDIDYPFHHPMIEAARPGFLAELKSVGCGPGRMTFISTVAGGELQGGELGPRYWWDNIQRPVQFEAATKAAVAADCSVFIEIGPRPILTSYLRDGLAAMDSAGSILATLERAQPSEADPVDRALCRAIAAGAAFDTAQVTGRRDPYIRLPGLPFITQAPKYPKTPEAIDLYGEGDDQRHTLLGWRVDPAGYVWRNHIDARLHPDLAEHVVDGRAIMPATGFIDMMVSAAREFHGDAEFELTNLELLQPLELSENRILEVTTILSPETGEIEIRSRERLQQADWALHAIGRCRPATSGDGGERIVTSGTGETLDVEDAYDTARRHQLDYGPVFRRLERVTVFEDNKIEVALKPVPPARHPWLRHDLHPVSADAVLHGLVALFSRIAQGHGSAPYIPVHFGSVRIWRFGGEIRSAKIRIERIGRYSLKAAIDIFDENGECVAMLRDCRMRRAQIGGRRPLEALTYHHRAIASTLDFAANRLPQPIRIVPPDDLASRKTKPDDASLILDAALYRAAYDVIRSSVSRNEDDDLVLEGAARRQAYLTCLLHGLAEVELAHYDETKDSWRLADQCELPEFEALLNAFVAEDSARAIEAILLNDAYRDALTADDNEPASTMSSSTLDHFHSHCRTTPARTELIAAALRNTLDHRDAQDPIRHIVELASVSKGLSRQLADIAEVAKARFTIIEPNARARAELEFAFRNAPHVDVLEEAESGLRPDILVTASARAHAHFADRAGARQLLVDTLERGGAFLACVGVGSFFEDFVFGLTDGWFADTVDPYLPVGGRPDVSDWQRLGEEIAVADAAGSIIETRFGDMLILAWDGEEGATAPAPAATGPATIVYTDDLHAPDSDDDLNWTTAAEMTASERPVWDFAPVAIFVSGQQDSGDGTEALLAGIETIRTVLVSAAEHVSLAAGTPHRLAVLLPGGAPGSAYPSDATQSGLWQFLRVARNEFADIAIHSLDFAGSDLSLDEQIVIARTVCESDGENREWLWDRQGGGLCEVRVVRGPASDATLRSADYQSACLRSEPASSINALEWEACDVPRPGAGEVAVAVSATALNYRDLMLTMGLLSDEAFEDGFAGPTVGMEFSGQVSAVGAGVEGFEIGDRVMGVAPASFATDLVTNANGIARLPDTLPINAGATIPVAFLTAWYGLMELGRLSEGETLLVHGGAGAVGLAALQIAKSAGANVIATAGTQEKRNLLTAFGADHVLDSRSLEFVDRVRGLTGGDGVDMVLNSLFADAMERSIALLKPFGRFIELGKRDYYADTKIGLRPFRQNISYYGVDADQLLKFKPEITARIFAHLARLFDEGALSPLPHRVYDHSEIRDAFRLMQSSGHIGKILVRPPRSGIDPVRRKPVAASVSDPDGIHIVVGGTRGFGLAAAGWLVERGARRLALVSQSGTPSEDCTRLIESWQKRGITVTVHACDASSPQSLAALLDDLRAKAPITGVLHAAMRLDDALLTNLNAERNRPVIEAKAKSAFLLHELTQADPVSEFILFSSMSTLIGNPGQSNYVAANGYLEGLARQRRLMGLPALAVGFSAISDTGYLADEKQGQATLSAGLDKYSMRSRDVLERLDDVMAHDPGTVEAGAVYIANIPMQAARALKVVASPLFDVPARSDHGLSELADGEFDFRESIAGMTAEEAERHLFDVVAGEIARTLHIPLTEVERDRRVKDIGIDSLMAMELQMGFQQKTGFSLPLGSITDATTVGDIARKLYLSLLGIEASETKNDDNREIVEGLAARHLPDAERQKVSMP